MPILAPLDAKELPFTVQRPANEMRERVVQREGRIRREAKKKGQDRGRNEKKEREMVRIKKVVRPVEVVPRLLLYTSLRKATCES